MESKMKIEKIFELVFPDRILLSTILVVIQDWHILSY